MRDFGLSSYLDAGVPLIYTRTTELLRTEQIIMDSINSLDRYTFGVWRVTTGAQFYKGNEGIITERIGNIRDILKCLGRDIKGPIVLIVYVINSILDSVETIQALLDSVFMLKRTGSHVVFMGSVTLPRELEAITEIIDIPAPSMTELKECYQLLSKDFKDKTIFSDDILDEAANAASGLPIAIAENALALSIAKTNLVSVQAIQQHKKSMLAKSNCLEYITQKETIKHLGGYAAYKDWLSKRKKAFSKEAREFGLKSPKGVLFIGIPGTGKSLAAKITANFLEVPLIRLDLAKVFHSFVGDSEKAILMALDIVEAMSPIVLWIDEIEKGLSGNDTTSMDAGVSARVSGAIMTWQQETESPVMLAITANDPEKIPSMFYRKGRIDEVWVADLPNMRERYDILKIHLLKRNIVISCTDLLSIAELSENFTGAELEYCIDDSMYTAFANGSEVRRKDLADTIRRTKPQFKGNKFIKTWGEKFGRFVS